MNLVKQIRLALLVKKYYGQFKELVSVKFTWPIFFIGIAILSHAATDLLPLVPLASKHIVTDVISVLAIIATDKSALKINPDGSPAELPYVKPGKSEAIN